MATPSTPSAAHPAERVRNFGTGVSQGRIHTHETTLYEYNVSSPDSTGVITHWWITGGNYNCDPPQPDAAYWGSCRPPFNSSNNWNPYIDHVIFRFYFDGEATPSIEMQPHLACGVGPFSSRTESSYDPPQEPTTCAPRDWHDGCGPCLGCGTGSTGGVPQTRAPWESKLFGKGSADGGWFLNARMPFGRSIRVTTELPPVPGHPEIASVSMYTQVRGAENVPVILGGVTLPPTARLHLQKIDGRNFDSLEWVPLLDVPAGSGAVLMNTLAVEAAQQVSRTIPVPCADIRVAFFQRVPATVVRTGVHGGLRAHLHAAQLDALPRAAAGDGPRRLL